MALKSTNIENKIPRFGGLAEVPQVSLRLIDKGNRLKWLFGQSLDTVSWVRLSETLPAEDDTAAVNTEEIPEAFAEAGLAYLGLETLIYTMRNDVSFTLDAVNGPRGYLNSDIREHLVDNIPSRNFKKYITTAPIEWINRPAVLTKHEVIDGVIGSAIETLLLGYLDEEPRPNDNGYTLVLKPELGKWQRTIGTSLETTGLVEGFHYSDGRLANELYYYEVVPEDSISNAGTLNCTLAAEHLEDAGTVEIVSVNTLRNCFGVVRGAFGGDASVCSLKLGGYGVHAVNYEAQLPSTPSSYGAEDTDTVTFAADSDHLPEIEDPVPATALQQYRLINQQCVHGPSLNPSLAEGLHKWPDAMINEFNSKLQCRRPGDPQLWFLDCALNPTGKQLDVRAAGYNFDSRNPPALFASPGVHHLQRSRLWYPLLREAGTDPLTGRVEEPRAQQDRYAAGTTTPLLEPAKAFWQGGLYLLIKDNVLSATTGKLVVQIDEKTEIGLEYDEVTLQEYNGEPIGWRVRITNESIQEWWTLDGMKPFGVWADRPKPVVRAGGALRGDLRQIIVQLMSSGRGEGGYPANQWNVLPRGLGLAVNPAWIDYEQILNYPIPAKFTNLKDFTVSAATVARDVVKAYLKACGLCLAMVETGNGPKIRLLPVRLTTERSSATIKNAARSDWVKRTVPLVPRKDAVQSSWKLEVNYDPVEKAYLRTPTFHDGDVIDAQGGAESPVETLSLRGLEADSDAELLVIFQLLRARYGKKVRLFEGSIMWSVAQDLDIGDAVTVTAISHYDANFSPVSITAKMLVSAISKPLVGVEVEVTLEYSGVEYGLWAPAAIVTAVVDVNTLEFGQDYGAGEGRPEDYGYRWFLNDLETVPAGGIPIYAVPRGDVASKASKTITAANTGTHRLTVTGHGLSVGDRIRPRDYAASNTWLRGFVHLHKKNAAEGDFPPWIYT